MNLNVRGLDPWRKSGNLTPTRTIGEVGFRKNGTFIDIWMRVNGKPAWFAVHARDVAAFLASVDEEIVLRAESDGNAEEVEQK